MKTIILWYRNDLRVHDLPALAYAANADAIVPVFIFDPTILKGKHASANRNRFLHESLQDLKASLISLGADLVIRSGNPSEVLTEMIAQLRASEVVCTEDFTPYAVRRDHNVADTITIPLIKLPGRLAITAINDIVTGSGEPYKVFTPFWRKWESEPRRELASIPEALTLPSNIAAGSIPTLESIAKSSELSGNPLIGGESEGRERMHEYLQSGIHQYDVSHDLVGKDTTSRLSSYIHFGCISIRELETILPDSDGAAAWHRQLCWRDFYHHILKHFPANATLEYQARYQEMNWNDNPIALQAWKDGLTGYPIVDAGMRQLKVEGWMHNRARLIVGSFLIKDLGIDWREGEKHFMKYLIDGDEANNNGNWQWIASVGVDPAPVFRRLYNPTKQQERFDPDGVYVRTYVPELSNVPDQYLSQPTKMDSAAQTKAGCIIGKDYPEPIVDHAVARLEALDRYRR